MPKLPSKWHCCGNYDDNNSSCDQWDNTSNYKHDISWRNNGDHVLQLAVMMSFVNRIIRKCMSQWQCGWGQIRISDKTKQANNRLRDCYCCVELSMVFNDRMIKQLILWKKFIYIYIYIHIFILFLICVSFMIYPSIESVISTFLKSLDCSVVLVPP